MMIDGKRIARVFPTRTGATPTDAWAFVGAPPVLDVVADEIHISVTFTWDIPKAEKLAVLWSRIAPVKIGGPAFNQPGGEFTPGLYMKEGYNITSRGCHNRCWFCSVWKRENGLRELEIKDGHIIQDDNILACSETHIRAVFDMLRRQKKRAKFVGGLEAKLLEPWHVDLLKSIRLESAFFAYDTPDDWEPLIRAAVMLHDAGFNRQKIFCYVLIGWPKDTKEDANGRLEAVKDLGMCPFAMLYRNDGGDRRSDWGKFQRSWARPVVIYAKDRKCML